MKAAAVALLGGLLFLVVGCSEATSPTTDERGAQTNAAVAAATTTPPVGVAEATPLPIPPRRPGTDQIPLAERLTLFPVGVARAGDLGLYTDRRPDPTSCQQANDDYRLIGYDIATADSDGQPLFDAGVGFDGPIQRVAEGNDGTWAVLTDCGEVAIVELGDDRGEARLQSLERYGFNVFTDIGWAGTTIELTRWDFVDGAAIRTITSLDRDGSQLGEPRVVDGPAVFAAGDLRFSTEPTEFIGGEGGDSWTITVERDGRFVRAINDPEYRDSVGLAGMWFGLDRSIAWISTLDFQGAATVARYEPDGHLIDRHGIEVVATGSAAALTPRYATFLADGRLLLLGYVQLNPGSYPGLVPAHGYHDLSTDSAFVESRDPKPQIDRDNPIRPGLENLDPLYRGETTGVEAECGSETIYGVGPDGLYRVLPEGIELPPVVQVVAGELRGETNSATRSDDVEPTINRSTLLLVRCPGDEMGRVVGLAENNSYLSMWTSDAAVAEILGIDETDPYQPAPVVEAVDGSVVTLALNTQLRDRGPLVELPPAPAGVEGPIAVSQGRAAAADPLQHIIELLSAKGVSVQPGGRNGDVVVRDGSFPAPIGIQVLPGEAFFEMGTRYERSPLGLRFSEGVFSGDAVVSGVSFACDDHTIVAHELYDRPGDGPSDDHYEYYLRGLATTLSWLCGDGGRVDPLLAPTPALAAQKAAVDRALAGTGWDLATAAFDHPGPSSAVFVLGQPEPTLQVAVYTDFEPEIDPDDIVEVYARDETRVTVTLNQAGDAVRAAITCGGGGSTILDTLGSEQPQFEDLVWRIYDAVCVR